MTETESKHEIGTTTRSVFEIGQSVAITLPKDFVEAHGIKKGDKLQISYNSFLLLEPKFREQVLKDMQRKKEQLKKEQVEG